MAILACPRFQCALACARILQKGCQLLGRAVTQAIRLPSRGFDKENCMLICAVLPYVSLYFARLSCLLRIPPFWFGSVTLWDNVLV